MVRSRAHTNQWDVPVWLDVTPVYSLDYLVYWFFIKKRLKDRYSYLRSRLGLSILIKDGYTLVVCTLILNRH